MAFLEFLRCVDALAIAGFATAGCGSGASTEAPACTTSCSAETPPAEGWLGVTVASPSIDVSPGNSGAVTVTVERAGNFTGAVTLSASRLPPGLGVDFNPNPIPPGSTTSLFTATSIRLVPDPLPAARGASTGNGYTPREHVAFGRSRHTIVIGAAGGTLSAMVRLNVLCPDTCAAP